MQNQVSMKPRYEHDCDGCTYLGTTSFPAPHSTDKEEWTKMKVADLYVCGQRDILGPSIIARMSSEGSDYSSAPASIIRDQYLTMTQFSTHGPALIAAYWFACAAGHVKHEVPAKQVRCPSCKARL